MGTYSKETGFSREYQNGWSKEFAVREIIQNNVYARQILGYTGWNTWKDGIATFEDLGCGIEKKYFLNGNSGQRETENSPGQFGEGMKLAFLIMARERKLCKVSTVGYDIEASFEYNQEMETEELYFHFQDNNKTTGTKFQIECTQEEYLNSIAYFGFLGEYPEKFTTSNNWEQKENAVFINGVKLDNENLQLLNTYNLIGKDIVNRDRNAVDNHKLSYNIWKQIICKTNNKDYIKKLLSNYKNSNLIEFSNTQSYGIENINLWKQIIHELYGKKICYSLGNNRADNFANYSRFYVLSESNYEIRSIWERLGIHSSNSLMEEKGIKYNCIQLKNLNTEEKENIKTARMLIQKYYKEIANLRYVENLEDSFGNPCNGLINFEEDLIYLDRSILNNLPKLIDVLIHETIHRETRADDCSERFQNEATKVAALFALGCTRAKRK